jgi:hypothetical protein
MKRGMLILSVILLFGCNDLGPTEPVTPNGLIAVSVHWGSQGIQGIPLVLMQTGDSVQTNLNGMAAFSVPGGKYVVRAYGINRGGPVWLVSDYTIEAKAGEVVVLDIVDCIPCL